MTAPDQFNRGFVREQPHFPHYNQSGAACQVRNGRSVDGYDKGKEIVRYVGWIIHHSITLQEKILKGIIKLLLLHRTRGTTDDLLQEVAPPSSAVLPRDDRRPNGAGTGRRHPAAGIHQAIIG
jgi:hypothetical protein